MRALIRAVRITMVRFRGWSDGPSRAQGGARIPGAACVGSSSAVGRIRPFPTGNALLAFRIAILRHVLCTLHSHCFGAFV